MMNVKELIEKLQQIEDKTLDIRLRNVMLNPNDIENYWLKDIEIHNKGYSGYELFGEVILYD